MSSYYTNDSMLWQSFKEGDSTAFEQIYQLNFNNLFEYGVRLCSDKNAVKDAIQDVFVKIWNNKKGLADVTNIKVYLLVSLRSVIYNSSKKNGKMFMQELDESADFMMTFSPEAAIIEMEHYKERSRSLAHAISQLSARQKEFIYLKYFQELEYEEIALIMKVSVKATYKLSARSLDALRDILILPKASVLLLLAADATVQLASHF